MHLMGKSTCSYFIWSWSQHVVAKPCTDQSFKTVQPHFHDVRNWTLQTLRVQNSINIISARRKITDGNGGVAEAKQWALTKFSLCTAAEMCDWSCKSRCTAAWAQAQVRVWPCHQERSLVFTALWRTGTEDARCLLHPMRMWPGLHLTYLVCMLALGKRTTTGMCILDILTNCQWLNTFNNDHHIQLENTEIFITKSICLGQVIRQMTDMNLLPSNMNGEVGLVLSNLWNSLIHSQRDCRCGPLRWLICSVSFFRNNIMLLSIFTSSTPPPRSWWLFYCAHNSNYICPLCLISPHLILVPSLLRGLFLYRKVILLQVSFRMRQATVVLHNEQYGWLLSFTHSRGRSFSFSPPVISSRSANCSFLSFLICLTFPDSQPSFAPLFYILVSLLFDVYFGHSTLKDETTALSWNIKNQVPNDAASFPRRMVTSWWHVLPSPQCSHNTFVQKIVAEYQEQGKPGSGYLYNWNHLTWSTNTEGFNEER